MNSYYYLDVLFAIESGDKAPVDIYQLKQIITRGIRDLFGEAGTGNQVDILKYSGTEGRVILRCFADFYVKLRASLSFCSRFEDKLCSFHIIKASPSLLSLQQSSRTYIF